MAQLYLDLDEIDTLFDRRWLWSVNRRNLAEFRRSDYLAPHDRPLAEVVRDRVGRASGHRPQGPVRLLTHLRYGGYVFNPVSFYYCFQPDGTTLDALRCQKCRRLRGNAPPIVAAGSMEHGYAGGMMRNSLAGKADDAVHLIG